MEGRRNIRQRLRADERERSDVMNKAKSLVRKIDEAEGVVRDARERECNTKAVVGLIEEIADLVKELERD